MEQNTNDQPEVSLVRVRRLGVTLGRIAMFVGLVVLSVAIITGEITAASLTIIVLVLGSAILVETVYRKSR